MNQQSYARSDLSQFNEAQLSFPEHSTRSDLLHMQRLKYMFQQRDNALNRWHTLFATVFVAVCLLPRAAAAEKPQLGINYNWYQLKADQISECASHPARVLWGGGVVQQYNDPKIREAVRGQLAEMHNAGFVSMRIILHASQLPQDHKEGLIHTVTGDISIEDQGNIRNFVTDVSAAGFRSLEVAFGFQGEGKLFCKKNDWGDCFDPGRTDPNWRFIDSSTALVKSAAQSMSLRFDLN